MTCLLVRRVPLLDRTMSYAVLPVEIATAMSIALLPFPWAAAQSRRPRTADARSTAEVDGRRFRSSRAAWTSGSSASHAFAISIARASSFTASELTAVASGTPPVADRRDAVSVLPRARLSVRPLAKRSIGCSTNEHASMPRAPRHPLAHRVHAGTSGHRGRKRHDGARQPRARRGRGDERMAGPDRRRRRGQPWRVPRRRAARGRRAPHRDRDRGRGQRPSRRARGARQRGARPDGLAPRQRHRHRGAARRAQPPDRAPGEDARAGRQLRGDARRHPRLAAEAPETYEALVRTDATVAQCLEEAR